MENKLSHYRTTLLINGILAILFGLFAIFVPANTSLTVVKYFGAILIIGGVFGLVQSIQLMKKNKDYLSPLVSSIISLLIGLFIVIYTHKSLEIFAIIMGVWALILGLVQLFIALNLFSPGRNKNLIIFNSIITILFGLILLFNPFGSMVALVFLVGIMALVAGSILVYFSTIIGKIKNKN
jgi:uncharacterized membrane protein HdeD (DUF308 family)